MRAMSKDECNGDSGVYTGPCGDSMRIFLKIKDDRVQQASFISDICIGAVACGNMMAEMVRGKEVREVLILEKEDVIKELGGLPEENEHCAQLAVVTLKKALSDYDRYRQAPWKRLYEK